MNRFVADVGNSRIKMARLDQDGSLREVVAVAIEDEPAWLRQVRAWTDPGWDAEWWISTVNPPATARMAGVLGAPVRMRLMRSAREISVPNRLLKPEGTGADRALAVLAALKRFGTGPGQVVSCGTAITVERVNEAGEWDGGAIAPGMRLGAQSLQQRTAQLPMVEPALFGGELPASWGRDTAPAIEAGVFWGSVGAVRELLARQATGFASAPWRVWTGGDAEQVARIVDGPEAHVWQELVLEGIAIVASGAASGV